MEQQHLHVEITGGGSEHARLPYLATVVCEHATSRMGWRRVCRNGCHLGPPERATGCGRVNPAPEVLVEMAVLWHGRRHGCGCDEQHWMRHGPIYPDGALFAIQPEDRLAPAEEYEALRRAGPSTDPWEPVC